MKQKVLSFATIVFLAVQFISCSSDDGTKVKKEEESGETVAINDSNLITALKELGYKFEGNAIKVDQKVKETQTLNLSSKQISDLEGIKAFENLNEIKLADNKLDMEFDFNQLPETVTAIELQGNDLYEFYNLAERRIDKLYLPEKARFNMEDVLNFYKTNKEAVDNGTIDMKMTVKGALKTYTTLREIPDPILREYMQETFPSLFPNAGDLLDIATPMRIPENTAELQLGREFNNNRDPNIDETRDPDSYDNTYLWMDEAGEKFKTTKIENYEGIQYVLQHKDYGATWININNNHQAKNTTIEYLKIPDNGISWFWMRNFHIPKGIKITNTSLKIVSLNFMSGFKTLDLSSSADLFVGGSLTMSGIQISNNPDLEEIIIPKSKLSDLQVGQIRLLYLPKLQKADLSHLNSFWGYSYFKGLPVWNVAFPKTLTEADYQINIGFDEVMLSTHKEKCIELMHKVEASTPKYWFFYCSINPKTGNWSNTIFMDKDGNLL